MFSFLNQVPEYPLAILIYLGGSALILWLWKSIANALPRPFGWMTWIIVLALLLTPTITDGVNAKLAPAIIGLMFGIISKDKTLILMNILPILFVMTLGFVLAFLWNKYQQQRVMSNS